MIRGACIKNIEIHTQMLKYAECQNRKPIPQSLKVFDS